MSYYHEAEIILYFECTICRRTLSHHREKKLSAEQVWISDDGLTIHWPKLICTDCAEGRQGSVN